MWNDETKLLVTVTVEFGKNQRCGGKSIQKITICIVDFQKLDKIYEEGFFSSLFWIIPYFWKYTQIRVVSR